MSGSAALWRLRVHEALPSTQDLCRTLAEAGEPDRLAVLARRQTDGRGRSGRGWDGGSGNLAVSVLLRPGDELRLAAQWSLLAALALAEALGASAHGGAVDIKLKWPNDILLGGRKLAGVLLDSASDGASLTWLVIGCGANLATAPELPDRPTARLAELGPPPAPEAVAWMLFERLDHWRRIRLADGFAPIRTAWLSHALPVGGPMTLRLRDGVVTGSFVGLSEDGGLLLQTGGRVHSFSAGEIILGGAA